MHRPIHRPADMAITNEAPSALLLHEASTTRPILFFRIHIVVLFTNLAVFNPNLQIAILRAPTTVSSTSVASLPPATAPCGGPLCLRQPVPSTRHRSSRGPDSICWILMGDLILAVPRIAPV